MIFRLFSFDKSQLICYTQAAIFVRKVRLMNSKVKIFLKNVEMTVVCAVSMFLLLILFVCSVFTTVKMETDNGYFENPCIISDNVIINILSLAVISAIVILFLKYCDKIKKDILIRCLLIYTLVSGIIWVGFAGSYPTHDSMFVSSAAFAAFGREYSILINGYFHNYPFQLGYVLFAQLFSLIRNITIYYFALQCINVLLLAVSYWAILKICSETMSERAEKLIALMLLLIPQPIMFCTFVYGTIPGFAFTVLSFYNLVRFNKEKRLVNGIFAALFIGIAVMLKLNYMIALVAEIIYLVFSYFENKRELLYKSVCIVLCVCSVMLFKNLPVWVYESVTDTDYGDGIPMTSWLAMGLSESEIAHGWYNGIYTVTNFSQHGYDADKASKASADVVKQRIDTFASDPKYAVDFFSEKFITQFNETSYQSIWTNEVRGHAYEPLLLAKFVLGEGKGFTLGYMDAVSQFIFAAALLGCVFAFKYKNDAVGLFLLTVIGGMIYHMLFEAKSQYFITYYVMLIPVAAYGAEAVSWTIIKMIGEKR